MQGKLGYIITMWNFQRFQDMCGVPLARLQSEGACARADSRSFCAGTIDYDLDAEAEP